MFFNLLNQAKGKVMKSFVSALVYVCVRVRSCLSNPGYLMQLAHPAAVDFHVGRRVYIYWNVF